MQLSSGAAGASFRYIFAQARQSIHWQVLYRLEKNLNLGGFLEKSLKIRYALKSTGKSLK